MAVKGVNLTPGVAGAERVHRTVLTVTQVRALNSTRREIIPAPGAGKVILPGRGVLLKLPSGTAFGGIAAGEDLTFRYAGGTVNPFGTIETIGFLSVTSEEMRFLAARPSAAIEPVEDAAVQIQNSGSITGGRSGLVIYAFYFIVEV